MCLLAPCKQRCFTCLGFCVKALLRFVQTGTLTENRMTVVEGWFAGKNYDNVPHPEDLPADFFNTFQASVAVNSSVSHCSELQTVVVCCTWHTLLSQQHVKFQIPPDLCLFGKPLVLVIACLTLSVNLLVKSVVNMQSQNDLR